MLIHVVADYGQGTWRLPRLRTPRAPLPQPRVEADATGARLLGDGRPLARALAKLEHAARVVPMDVEPAQSAKYIVNPLTGRHVNFARLFMTHPSTDERIRRLVSGEWAA